MTVGNNNKIGKTPKQKPSTTITDKGIVGFHDSRCAIHKGHSCNCALAAFVRKDKSCGNRFCMKYNVRCPSCGRVNGITD